jgi:D-3-phosphoglycerate dehydrogenase
MTDRPIVVVAGSEMPNDLAIEKQCLEAIGAELVDGRGLGNDELFRCLEGASALLTEGFVKLDRAILQRLARCKAIAFYAIGIETIDIDAASQLGIIVTNVPGYCTDEVADHTMLLLLAVWRRLPAATRIATTQSWNLSALRPIHGLRGRTLGLVGYGGIARALAARVRAIGMQVVAYDPYALPLQNGDETKLVELNTLFAVSEAVSLHLPLTPETIGIVGRKQLDLLCEGAVLINTSRGGVIDEDALLEALDSGRLKGAGLDVLASEPATRLSSRRLISHNSVICTPHMGYYSEDALRTLRSTAASAVADVLQGAEPDHRLWINRAQMMRNNVRHRKAGAP